MIVTSYEAKRPLHNNVPGGRDQKQSPIERLHSYFLDLHEDLSQSDEEIIVKIPQPNFSAYRDAMVLARYIADAELTSLRKARTELTLEMEEMMRMQDEGCPTTPKKQEGRLETLHKAVSDLDQSLPAQNSEVTADTDSTPLVLPKF